MTQTAESLDLRRKALECRKLEAEIAEVERAWWKRPAYLGALVPIVLASLTFATAVFSGWFDDRRATLERDVAQLQDEKDRLQSEVTAIQKTIDIAYLSTLSAAEDAAYALKHMDGIRMDPVDFSVVNEVELPDEVMALLNRLTEHLVDMSNINGISRQAVEDLQRIVGGIPATEIFKTGKFDPLAAQRGLRLLADGRYVDVNTAEFLGAEEASRRLQ